MGAGWSPNRTADLAKVSYGAFGGTAGVAMLGIKSGAFQHELEAPSQDLARISRQRWCSGDAALGCLARPIVGKPGVPGQVLGGEL